MKLEGKIALVTGSSRGIGRATALCLAEAGADLIVNYREREDKAQEVVAQIGGMGRQSVAIKADVARIEEVKSMVQSALERFGKIDILVNNAGIHRGRRVHKLSEDDWDLVIDSSLGGAFHCCKLIIPSMLEQGWGRIVNITSQVGVRGYQGDTAYGSAKAGLIGFTKCLARETATSGITVNAIVCGYIDTDIIAFLRERLGDEGIVRDVPMRRLGHPEEVGEVVTFLASAASYITGAVINVDGGLAM